MFWFVLVFVIFAVELYPGFGVLLFFAMLLAAVVLLQCVRAWLLVLFCLLRDVSVYTDADYLEANEIRSVSGVAVGYCRGGGAGRLATTL